MRILYDTQVAFHHSLAIQSRNSALSHHTPGGPFTQHVAPLEYTGKIDNRDQKPKRTSRHDTRSSSDIMAALRLGFKAECASEP